MYEEKKILNTTIRTHTYDKQHAAAASTRLATSFQTQDNQTRMTLERARLFPGGYAPRPPWLALRARFQYNIDHFVYMHTLTRARHTDFFSLFAVFLQI